MTPMTTRERLLTALRRGTPDRVPCFPDNVRWLRYHYRCTCPRHQLLMAERFGFDAMLNYGQYIWNSLTNDYCYAPGGQYASSPLGLYGDLPDVDVTLRIENTPEHVWYHRTFQTPAGSLNDVIQWSRPDMGFGDGPNPHRVEPLVKTEADLDALQYLFPPPRREVLADLSLLLDWVGERALVAACDNTHIGSWGPEVLGVEDRLVCSITSPRLLHRVCRITQDVHLRNLRAMLERGVPVVFDSWFQSGLSVGWSPKAFREFFLPLVKETADLVHAFGAIFAYYDAGRMMPIIPMLVEAGVDVLCGLQPPPVGDVVLGDLKRQYGDRVAFMGGVDPCYVFDRGNPEKVRETVRRTLAEGAPGGGFVIGTALSPAPETPVACLEAASQAVQDCGVYR